METDIGSWTSADRGVREGTPRILKVLRSHRVKATFLFTGREAQNNPDVVQQILSDGHEVGCHTMYHENVGRPVYEVPIGSFVLDSEVRGRLELATEAIERVAGVRPCSFRAPRLFGSTTMIIALEELGYTVDSSFPCYYWGRDFAPYRPSREDWAKEGNMRILELPVFYDLDAGAGDPKRRGRDQWPMLRLKGSAWFSDLCRRMLARAESRAGNAVLCVYLHPWEFVQMPQSIATDESRIHFRSFLHRNCGTPTLRALDEFLGAMNGDKVRFATMKDFASSYRSFAGTQQA